MTKNIFIATAEPYSGKSIVALGLVNMLLGKTRKVGYFKPIINYDPKEKKDVHIQTIVDYFSLPVNYDETYALTRQEAMRQLEGESQGQMMDTIISKFKKLEENYDFTVIEGSDFVGEGAAFEFEANVSIAKNLGAPAIIVVSGEGKTTAQIVNSVFTMLRNFEAREVQVLAIVANKVKQDQAADVKELLTLQLPKNAILAVIPEDKGLLNPTMKEIYENLGGNLLFGEEYLSNQVDNFVTGAMNVPNFLRHIKDNVLIVTPGDRGDIIIGSLQANISTNYPKVAGIVLSAGSIPEEPIIRLIEGSQTVVPIISVNTGTFQTIAEIASIKSRITTDNTKKIQLAIDTFDKYVDVQALDQKIVTFTPEGITPHMFQYQLGKWAKSEIKHIVLPEGDDERVLKAAARLISQEIVNLTILGDASSIAAAVKRLGLDLDLNKVRIINPAQSEFYDDYVETLYELRKNKNVTMEMARDLMTDVSYFGTMMVYKGHADGMVSGAVHTTQHTIRPALQFVKTKPGISVVSSVFFMCLPDRVSVFGDCAVNPNPTAEQLAEIAISSAESSIRFGIEPRIAMLSYSSGTSGEGADVDKVRKATEIVKQKRPDLKVEGPIQYDAAVDPVVGKQKMPNSEVAGQASVLIFPDLNTGNNTYKAVQRETGALAIGPMLQGLNKPVNDLSRGCTVDDIFNTVIITAIQSQNN
ncbi:phosphate acetyltransferase [Arcticibacter tournemirensis]|uniref:Phosphate acetyltransferase n=1 Tax=Arcticibacter tournemirensis TaxID=699437 RepID=A0A5M9H9D4_9SPHI|nr:phosphate acetyltransferase [Arcticibacter tournemirensis]KAA8481687.1 phosphate acetyltransferase [Arcticibacter tournemirensis]TQM48912.1 phosphate acetyltransferase [Arcticibacter tournemirensis]